MLTLEMRVTIKENTKKCLFQAVQMLLNNFCLRENNNITSNKLSKKENFQHSHKFQLFLCKY